ncbi:MAG: hypothetical protein ACNS64_15170, partial [Candidatus Halalkalibacterium sp. M3_1C_030]
KFPTAGPARTLASSTTRNPLKMLFASIFKKVSSIFEIPYINPLPKVLLRRISKLQIANDKQIQRFNDLMKQTIF